MHYINRQFRRSFAAWFCCLFLLPLFSVQAEKPMPSSPAYNAQESSTWEVLGVGTVPLILTLGLDNELAGLLQIDESNTTALLAAKATSQVVDKAGLLIGHVVLYSQNKELAWRSAKAVAVTSAVTVSLKTLLGRARPYVGDNQGKYYGFNFSDDYHSMPSGHTATAFAMARVLAKEDPKHAYAYYAAAALVGLSRVQLRRHWPSDVIAGALLGYTVGSFF